MSDVQPQENPPKGAVMDVQPPVPSASHPPESPTKLPHEAISPDTPGTPEGTTIPPEAVATTVEETVAESAVATENPENVSIDGESQKPPEEVQPLLAAQSSSSSSRFRPVVVVAVVVLLALSGVAITAYTQNRKAGSDDPAAASHQSGDTSVPNLQQTVKDTQQATSDVLDADEAVDFPESELTDEALGL